MPSDRSPTVNREEPDFFGVIERDQGAGLAAILAAFCALGFFAASILSVFWLLVVVGSAAGAVFLAALTQDMGLLHAFGLSLGAFALSQVGYGLGLVWVARSGKRCIPD